MPDHMVGRTIEELRVGEAAVFTKTVSVSDIETFARLTGDSNPLHTDPAFAKTTRFGERIAQGMLSASIISAVIGTKLPGPGTIYVSQDLRFLRPVKIGDTIVAKVEVVELHQEKNRVKLRTTCLNQMGEEVIDGHAFVIPPKAHERRQALEGKAENPEVNGFYAETAKVWARMMAGYMEASWRVMLLPSTRDIQRFFELVFSLSRRIWRV